VNLYTVRSTAARRSSSRRRTRAPTRTRVLRRTGATSPTRRSGAPAFESDRWRLMLHDRAARRVARAAARRGTAARRRTRSRPTCARCT
jgi:hypothetical protein